jgi:hypothetical protein
MKGQIMDFTKLIVLGMVFLFFFLSNETYALV